MKFDNLVRIRKMERVRGLPRLGDVGMDGKLVPEAHLTFQK